MSAVIVLALCLVTYFMLHKLVSVCYLFTFPVDTCLSNWAKKINIDISGSTGPSKSLRTGKFSLSQGSVNWKFVTVALDIPGFIYFLNILLPK